MCSFQYKQINVVSYFPGLKSSKSKTFGAAAVKDSNGICRQYQDNGSLAALVNTHNSFSDELSNVVPKVLEQAAGRAAQWIVGSRHSTREQADFALAFSLCLWVDFCTFVDLVKTCSSQSGAWVISWITLPACKETSLN